MIPYLAGFFDGEGCITVGSNGSVNLRMVNTSLPVLEKFLEHLGGSLLARKQIVNKKQYVWSVYGEAAKQALIKIQPHLIDKSNQAIEVLNWIEERKSLSRSVERSIAVNNIKTKLTKMKLGIYAI